MFLSISECLVEFFRGNPADFQFWLHHIESVYIRVVNIYIVPLQSQMQFAFRSWADSLSVLF